MMRVFSFLCLLLIVTCVVIGSALGAEEFRAVTGPCDFSFPRDHGAHEGYRTEWWYYTGNLESASNERYGFQLTFFRTQLVPPGEEKAWPAKPSAWRTKNLYFAHAALSDLAGNRYYHDERVARDAVGMGGVAQKGGSTTIFLDNWSALLGPETHRLSAVTDTFMLDLSCKPAKPAAVHGLEGYSRKGKNPESASCYYSFTRLETSGIITVRGVEETVHGTAWMDHEFSSAPLEKDLTGWDWFGLQLDDRTEVMIYLLRLDSGGYSPASSGTFVKHSGESVHLNLEDFQVEVLDRWKSPHSGAMYPSKWRIRVLPLHLELSIAPNLADQELMTTRTTRITYWEGSVSISGRSGDKPVNGVGYVEMTGYAKPFNLTPSP
jgi:predicted secreted hydrolase